MEALRAPSSATTLPAWPAGRPLRAWQETALARVLERPSGDFLASATPAAGKTTFGPRVAHDLLYRGLVRRVCVVAPTTHICRQWPRTRPATGSTWSPTGPTRTARSRPTATASL